MENVFEPMENFVDEVFEPMSNFATKKTPEQKSDELSTILQQLKKVEDIEKVKTAVETGGLGAGTVLAKTLLEFQNKKSSFAGTNSFLNDPRIVWDLSKIGQSRKNRLMKDPMDYYTLISAMGTESDSFGLPKIPIGFQFKTEIINKIKEKNNKFRDGYYNNLNSIEKLLYTYLYQYGKPYELNLEKYKFNSIPLYGIKKINYNPNNLNDRLNPFYEFFKTINPKLYKLSSNVGKGNLVASNQKNIISSFDDFENFEGDDFSNFGLREWWNSKFSTQSAPNELEEKKIFGIPKKRAISVGVIALAVGITTYLILKNKK